MSVLRILLSAIRSLWLIFGLSLLCLVLVERVLDAVLADPPRASMKAGAHMPDPRTADAYAADTPVQSLWRELDQCRRMRWESWAYWRRAACQGEQVNVGAQGLRATPGSIEGADLRIALFGGSTMWGTGTADADTVPARLAALLRTRGIEAEVVNFGESGYVSRQGRIAFENALRAGYKPDVAIFLDGVNDVAAAWQSGRAGIPQNESKRAAEFELGRSPLRGLVGALLRAPGFAKLLARPAPALSIEPLALQIADQYALTVETTAALAHSQGVASLHYWQPSLFSKSALSAFEQTVLDASAREHVELQRATDLAVARSPRLSEVSGHAALLDLFGDSAEPAFVDFCHMAAGGNQRLAERLLADVLRVLAPEPPRPADAAVQQES